VDAGAGADVGEAAARQRKQELEAETRRRMRTRAERPARIDDDRKGLWVRLLPRRAHPERPDPKGPVEPTPCMFPPTFDLLGSTRAEHLPEPLLASRVRVRGELDAVREVALLEPLREELEHHGSRLLGAGASDAD
jgi:hypothetical protein